MPAGAMGRKRCLGAGRQFDHVLLSSEHRRTQSRVVVARYLLVLPAGLPDAALTAKHNGRESASEIF